MAECIISGRQGPKGDIGPQGIQGPTGPQGPTGSSSLYVRTVNGSGNYTVGSREILFIGSKAIEPGSTVYLGANAYPVPAYSLHF